MTAAEQEKLAYRGLWPHDRITVDNRKVTFRLTQDGQDVFQYRWIGNEGEGKYTGEQGKPIKLALLRKPTDTLLIIEGTKQSLVAEKYAPESIGIGMIAGCYSWSKDGLVDSRFEIVKGRNVLLWFDGDTETNPNVYSAATKLRKACESLGARSVRFIDSGATGTDGLDDLIVDVPEKNRKAFVADLLAKTMADAAKIPPGRITVAANDHDIAVKWMQMARDRLRWSPNEQAWFSYSDGVWRKYEDSSVALRDYTDVALQELLPIRRKKVDGEWVEEPVPNWGKDSGRDMGILRRAKTVVENHVDPEELDSQPWIFNAANTAIDLRTQTAIPFDPDHLATRKANVHYNPDASCPRFLEFLRLIQPDVEMRGYLQRLFGMSLVGEQLEHVFPVFTGNGGNGKGTLFRIMHELMGRYAVKIKDDLLLKKKNAGHPTELMSLKGSRLAYGEETERGADWDIARVCDLTGGGIQTARGMRENEQQFRKTWTLAMAVNNIPNVDGSQSGFWRRYHEIAFDVAIGEGVTALEGQRKEEYITKHELSGIFNWMLAGLGDYLERGELAPPLRVYNDSAQYRAESDPIFRFISQNVRKTDNPEDFISSAALRDRYDEWRRIEHAPEMHPRAFKKEFCGRLGLVPTKDGDCPKRRTEVSSAEPVFLRVQWADEDFADDKGPFADDKISYRQQENKRDDQGQYSFADDADDKIDINQQQKTQEENFSQPLSSILSSSSANSVFPQVNPMIEVLTIESQHRQQDPVESLDGVSAGQPDDGRLGVNVDSTFPQVNPHIGKKFKKDMVKTDMGDFVYPDDPNIKLTTNPATGETVYYRFKTGMLQDIPKEYFE